MHRSSAPTRRTPPDLEYARHFGDHRPARAAVEVARLPKDVRIEIDAIALTE
ncbi:MAG: hypothetical protein IIB35_08355 [Gemmatimonadetes bacterium]|nr:hypothetical protein [Gemmatimonadota bacterium]MCH8937388.1 hypothetical protein [Gemmatimonadota bacterium]